MRGKLRTFSLITFGALIGIAISLHFSAVANKEADSPLPIDELRAFTEVFAKIKSDYVEPIEDKKLINEAINGMLTGLDPHSAYLDQDAFKDLQVSTQGEFGGLGIEVGMEDGFVKVVSPIEDTPAYQAGVKSGDLIIKLDETPVKGLTLSEAVKRMRGKPNTKITLTILRKGETKPIIVTLTRAVIQIKSVKSRMLDQNYGYVRITQFQEHTGEDLVKAINGLAKSNKAPLNGLVLDLRNDPGGLLNSAIAVSAAFLPKDALVVYTEGRAEDAKLRFVAAKESYARGAQGDYLKNLPDWTKSVPMIVLVNGGSASASEIVAGALKDHKRAIIMGTQTFGKGSVQSILPLGNGTAIKLTTARYYTPSGNSIQAKGIVPDIAVEEATVNETEKTNLSIREADLDRHLINNQDGDAKTGDGGKPADSGVKLQAPKKGKEKSGKGSDGNEATDADGAFKRDYQLSQALNLLKGLQILKHN